MLKRLLIALPVAAGVVVGLYWAMDELLPVGRAKVDYKVRVSQRTVTIYRCPHSCTAYPPSDRRVERPDENNVATYRQLPLPPRPLPGTGDFQAMPRDGIDPPEVSPPDSKLPHYNACVPDHPIVRLAPIWPKDARDGDYVILEFTLPAYGIPGDFEVVESSNPKINRAAVRTAQRWRYKPNCIDGELVETEPKRVRTKIEYYLEPTDNDASRR